MFLQDYDYTVEHRAGNRMQHVDALSRHTVLFISAEDNLQLQVQKAQMNDDELKPIFEILKSQAYENYWIRGGVLYKQENGMDLLVVPRQMETDVIKQYHQNGHGGIKKVEIAIKQNFFIRSLTEKIKKVIGTCVPCILAERKHGKQEGWLHPIEKEDLPLQTFHMDHIGPMVATTKQYKYILVVVDAFTKYTWLFPTKSTTTKEVLDKIAILQGNFGNPRRIITDRGTAFTSSDFKDYCEQESVQHVKITTGMPRGNGQVERVNRSIIPILTKASMADATKWYIHIPRLQKSLNNTFHRSIAMTPFKLMFGVEMRSKEDIQMAELLEEDFIQQYTEDRQEDREIAKAQIERVQNANQVGLNKKRKNATNYAINQLVAIKRTQFVNGNKLAQKFLGPYRVNKQLPNEGYEVQKEGNHAGPKQTTTSAEFMKPWLVSLEGE